MVIGVVALALGHALAPLLVGLAVLAVTAALAVVSQLRTDRAAATA